MTSAKLQYCRRYNFENNIRQVSSTPKTVRKRGKPSQFTTTWTHLMLVFGLGLQQHAGFSEFRTKSFQCSQSRSLRNSKFRRQARAEHLPLCPRGSAELEKVRDGEARQRRLCTGLHCWSVTTPLNADCNAPLASYAYVVRMFRRSWSGSPVGTGACIDATNGNVARAVLLQDRVAAAQGEFETIRQGLVRQADPSATGCVYQHSPLLHTLPREKQAQRDYTPRWHMT